MDNKEQLKYLVLKTFYDNIPNQYFGLISLAILMMFFPIGILVLIIAPIKIASLFISPLPIKFIFIPILLIINFLFILITLLNQYEEYDDIDNRFVYNRTINDKYIDKVMDKIKHQFLSMNNIHLENTSKYIDYPDEIPVIINEIMQNLISKEGLATYHDIVQLYEKYEEKAPKYE